MTKEKYDVIDEDLQKSEYTTRKNINNKVTAAKWREQIQNNIPPRRHRRIDPMTAQIIDAPLRKNPGNYYSGDPL